MRRRVLFRILALEGFGLFRRPTRFLFPAGLGVLALPNENGKSTMVSGLKAVLFGLPARGDRGDGGIERYRSWGSSDVCRGRLDLMLGKTPLRIRRDLLTHQTIAEETESDGSDRVKRRLFDAAANPEGRTYAKRSWTGFLAERIGDVAEEKLFTATFLVEQPVLPAGEMGEALEKLVGGVGRVGGQDAKDRLFETVKALTRATGDRDLIAPKRDRPRNQGTDGRIEQVAERIAALEAGRAAAAGGFARQVELAEHLRAARAREEAGAHEDAEARAEVAQVDAYRKERALRDDARRAIHDLNRVLEGIDAHAKAAAQSRANLAASYADLLDAPLDLAERVEAARGIESRLAGRLESAAEQRATAEELSRECERLAAEADADRELAGHSGDLPVKLLELMGAHARLREIEEKCDRLRAERESTERILADHGRWTQVRDGGPSPDPSVWLARAQAAAEGWIAAVGRFIAIEGRRGELLSRRERLSSVAVLPDEVQEALARREGDRGDRERVARLSVSLRRMAEDQSRRREQLRERYACLEGIDPQRFLAVLEARAAQHRRIRELQEGAKGLEEALAARPQRRRWRRALAIGVPGAGAVATAALASGLDPIVAALLFAALLLLSILGLATPAPSAPAARERLETFRRDIEGARNRLSTEFLPSGPWLPDDEGVAERARALIEARDLDAASLERSEAALREAEALDGEGAPEEGDAAAAAVEQLEETARRIEEASGVKAAGAVREYREICAQLHEIAPRRAAAWREAMGPDAPVPEDGSDPLALPVTACALSMGPIVQASEILDLPCPRLRELYETFAALKPDRWSGWESEARAFTAARSRREEIDRALTEIDRADSSGRSERERLADAIVAGRAACAPFDETANQDEITARWRKREQVARRLAEASNALSVAQEHALRTNGMIASLQEELGAAGDALGGGRLAASEGSLARLRDRIGGRDLLLGAAESADRAYRDLLATAPGGPFPDREALIAALAREDEKRRDAQVRIDLLRDASEQIRSFDEAEPAERDRIRRSIETRAGEAARSFKDAERALAESAAMLDAWRPPEAINLAAIELEIEEKKSELASLEERADAAARAWHLLDDAIRDFRANHRADLERSLDERFRSITGRDSRRIRLDDRLSVQILEDGLPTAEAQLSQGARDQLAFCLRLAVADLVAGEVLLPVILDDPFVHSDAVRLERIRGMLETTARERQIILLTQDPRLLAWGEPIAMEST